MKKFKFFFEKVAKKFGDLIFLLYICNINKTGLTKIFNYELYKKT